MDETDDEEEMDEIDDDDSLEVRDDEQEMVEEDETDDEDSDTPPARKNHRDTRSKRIRQRQSPTLGLQEEDDEIIHNSSSTADVALLERENARLRQLVLTLQSTFVTNQQETQNLNRNLQNLTTVVARMAGGAAQESTQPQTQPMLQEKPCRAPRGGALTVSQSLFPLVGIAC